MYGLKSCSTGRNFGYRYCDRVDLLGHRAFLADTIILFDSIALGIVAGVCCNSFTPIHPALCLVIGIAVFLLLLWLQRTSVGFWVIGGLLTLIYAAAAGLLACLLTEKDLVWGWVTFGIVFLVIGGLHLHARDN